MIENKTLYFLAGLLTRSVATDMKTLEKMNDVYSALG